MPTVYQDIEIRSKGTQVIDNITQKLGILNKQGLAVGVGFAVMNKAVELSMTAFRYLTDELKDGIESSRKLQLNLVYATNTIDEMDISVVQLRRSLEGLSTTFGVDVNVIAENLRVFSREGYSATQSLNLLNQTERFSKATGEDFNGTVDAMNTTMEVFDLKYNDSSFILNEFNKLVDETGMSVSDIEGILSKASPNIRESGLGLGDIVDILYTLHEQGDAPKTMLAEINDVLKDLENRKIDILPESEVKSIKEKFAAIAETNMNFWDKFGMTMDRGARETVDTVGRYFDAYTSAWGHLYDIISGKKIEPVKTSTAPEGGVRKDNPLATWMNGLVDVAKNMPAINQEIFALKGQQEYITSLHVATKAVQAQEDAIEKLRRKSNIYSLEQQENSLDIMRIEYGAGGRRLRRNDREKIEQIQRENLRLQILETEQGIKIGKIQQGGLQSAQDDLDEIRQKHDEALYKQELAALNVQLDTEYAMYDEFYTKLGNRRRAYLQSLRSINPTATSNNDSSQSSEIISWLKKTRGFATGGPVLETGLAMVHKGEYVLPRSNTASPSNTMVNIKIDLSVKNQDNLEHLAIKIGQLISQGVLTGLSSNYHLGG